MTILEQFAASLQPEQDQILQDVREYIEWRSDGGQVEFVPRISDDVILRTYLLKLRVQGADREVLDAKVESLKQFYDWVHSQGLISASPFDEYNLLRQFLPRNQIRRRQDIFTGEPQEREIARLRALNSLASGLNRTARVQTAIEVTLTTLVEVMALKTAWAFLKTDSGLIFQTAGRSLHDFALVAETGLPPGLERNQRYFLTKPPDCHCQALLRGGTLERAVNIVECDRLQSSAEAEGDNRGLLFHASVPLTLSGQPVGIMNFATEEWQFLSAADLQLLSSAGEQLSAALERMHLFELTRAQKSRLERELDVARRVQSSLIPKILPEIPFFGLASAWRSAREVAGDFYDVLKLPGGRWGLVIADVADKGVPASLFMAMTRSLIRSHAEDSPTPAELITRVNRDLCRQSDAGMFVTAFYGVLDPNVHQLTYTLAGHNPPVVRRARVGLSDLSRCGMAMGVLPDASYSQAELVFEPDDALIMYTDGVTEALNANGEEYGVDRMHAALQSAPASAQAILGHLLADLEAFTGPVTQSDDLTLCVLKYEPDHSST